MVESTKEEVQAKVNAVHAAMACEEKHLEDTYDDFRRKLRRKMFMAGALVVLGAALIILTELL